MDRMGLHQQNNGCLCGEGKFYHGKTYLGYVLLAVLVGFFVVCHAEENMLLWCPQVSFEVEM